MRSLRARMILGSWASISLFLALGGVAIDVVIERRLRADLDRGLLEVARASAPVLARRVQELRRPLRADGPDAPRPMDAFRPSRVPPLSFPTDAGDLLFECWDEDGAPLEKSEQLGEGDLPRLAAGLPALPPPEAAEAALELHDVTLPGGARGRAVGLRVLPPHREGAARFRPRRRGPDPADEEPLPPFEAVLARDATAIAETHALVRLLLLGAWGTACLGSAAILFWVAHRSLRPLDELRAQLAAMEADALDRSVDLPHAPAELAPVVRQLDALFARLRASFEREQSFAANAAHELRTPIAGLRSTLEVALDAASGAADREEAARTCLDITLQMQKLVEDLLSLARAEAGVAARRDDVVELAPLVDACWSPCAADAAARALALVRRVPDGLALRSDRVLLARALGNLVENAVAYADPASELRIEAVAAPEALLLRVDNALADPPPDLAARACDPFWRGERARSATGRHAGLGLALCRRFARLVGGELTLEVAAGRFRATLRLPRDGHREPDDRRDGEGSAAPPAQREPDRAA